MPNTCSSIHSKMVTYRVFFIIKRCNSTIISSNTMFFGSPRRRVLHIVIAVLYKSTIPNSVFKLLSIFVFDTNYAIPFEIIIH